MVSGLAGQYLLAWLPDLLRYVAGMVVLIASAAVALPATAMALRPMRGLFVTHNALSNVALVGSSCRVLTLEVTEQFGRAEVATGGAGINIRVRADTPNPLTKGSPAVIVDYDAGGAIYTIVAIDDS
ncbi:hypothetical protein [Chitiniphilus eburneus]|uniref:hypothetical protein n=1 Tax=Chitiniphilus eburneus TaxID=2571148 RepID=UPI001B7FBF7D|nr:hypothetical protein [Chitiniphilus eburneus]